ncbi:MAG: radical SAM protein [Terriglobales bacterium]
MSSAASLPLFPEPAPVQLAERHLADFTELPIRSILNRCTSSRVPFAWTINPYRGCEFGCQYCYARYTHEFMELRRPEDFERHIFVKQNAAARLRRELKRVKPDEEIALGTATDPYQPAERRFGVTRSLLEVFAEFRGLRLGLITKSDLIARDRDLLAELAARHRLRIRITVTTTDIALARALEPRAPRPDLRLAAAATLAAAGLDVGIMCAPVLPAITDSRAALTAVAHAARAAGARTFAASPLFLQPCAQAQYFPFLERAFPQLVARYRRAYSHTAYLPAAYRQALQSRVWAIRAEIGLASMAE